MTEPRRIPETDPDARRWTRDTLETGALRYTLPPEALAQIDAALALARENGLTIDTVEQEDFRIPALARDVPELRRRLDAGAGFVVVSGIPEGAYDETESEIVAWAICNYMGAIIRQGIGQDRRFFTVSDKGMPNGDPTRIGASPKRSPKHSDNGCLEPRAPDYLALYCVRSAAEGGESTLISARTIHDTVAAERPDLLPLLFETYHFRAPQAHVWPSEGPTKRMPVLEVKGGELLLLNNLVLLHGREAFAAGSGGRTLKRFWMWRRHIGPGTDPVALDMEEFA
ncbi:TauD/TfdA family dioxygenase [Salipiger mucosus]|uniref:TauD/TfdA-like domain-containing protein n=1 Tax=Salipiger mucosus DSM 16094 TaxID=1123237 RepID=S9SFS3_9RHOB|nr:TauD/TfdA family dioxygenase [Salipiger mucosus]EPX85099.1 hypothetical protein Salmuc_01055 [Salipiger mucosus DSM 16094]